MHYNQFLKCTFVSYDSMHNSIETAVCKCLMIFVLVECLHFTCSKSVNKIIYILFGGNQNTKYQYRDDGFETQSRVRCRVTAAHIFFKRLRPV